MRSMPARKRARIRKHRQPARNFHRETILRGRKVEELHARIERGEYFVSARQIAAAMLAEGVGLELSVA